MPAVKEWLVRGAMLRLLLGLAAALFPATLSAEDARPRLVVLTDIGGDPDDQQSLVRLLVHANEFEIEGLIASAAGTPNELKERVTRADLIEQMVEAYGTVQPNLARHAAGFPTVEDLRDVIRSGNPNRGRAAIGAAHDTAGSRWIAACVDREDSRPLHVVIWGGQTDLAQALWRARHDRGPDDLAEFKSRLRVFDIADQDSLQAWICAEFPDLFYVLSKAPPGVDKREGAFRGMYLGGDESLTSLEWIDAHVRQGHGALGALYPSQTWTQPNRHGALKEGDSPSWLGLLPNGLNDAEHPEWGGWGGRYVRVSESAGLRRDAPDTFDGHTDARTAVWRWRPAFQNAFAARMHWCVAEQKRAANHIPTAVLNGERGVTPVRIVAQAGATIQLSARGSSDPDGQAVHARWLAYPEAGTCGIALPTGGPVEGETLTLQLPADAPLGSLHVVLELTDAGRPPLTSYRRAIIEVTP